MSTTGNCGFANNPELSHQPRPELLAKKIFPNRKTLLLGKKSSPTTQNPRTDGKVWLLAKGFFPNNIPVGKEKLLVKPQCGQTVPVPSASPTASPLDVGKGNNPSPLLVKRTAPTPFGRAGASPTAFLSQQECCWERTPSLTAELCHQSLDFGLLAKISFPTTEFSCRERFSSPTA
jgi:hypothetical protein